MEKVQDHKAVIFVRQSSLFLFSGSKLDAQPYYVHIYFTLYIPVICSIQVGHHGLLSTVVVGSTADAVGSVCQLLWLEQQLVLLALLSTAVVGTTAGAVGSVINCCG